MTTKPLDAAMHALDAKYRRPGLWKSLTHVEVHTAPGVVVLRGALPTTMHFGAVRLELATGVLTWTDEDHRDGGDFEAQRVTITAEELAQVHSLLG